MIPVEIFFSYAHKDEPLLQELKVHLSPLKRQGLIDIWYDRNISAGTNWEPEINEHLNNAQVILLLVSPDFVASDYCYSIEMTRALERHNRGEAIVIPIVLRWTADWEHAPFGKIQALPTGGRPVKDWEDQDKAFYNVAVGIHTAIVKRNAPSQQQAHGNNVPLPPQPDHQKILTQPTSEDIGKPADKFQWRGHLPHRYLIILRNLFVLNVIIR